MGKYKRMERVVFGYSSDEATHSWISKFLKADEFERQVSETWWERLRRGNVSELSTNPVRQTTDSLPWDHPRLCDSAASPAQADAAEPAEAQPECGEPPLPSGWAGDVELHSKKQIRK